MRRMGYAGALTLACWLGGIVRADVRPDALCGEGMVLQQKSNAKIWGEASPDEKVTVTFRGKSATSVANNKGKWVVTVETGAAGGPFEMTIQGNNKVEYKDVLVGEVWICSGQSNMEWSIAACDKSDKDAAANAMPNPYLRIFQVKKAFTPTVVEKTTGKWVSAKADALPGWTATGYFFGRHLNEKLKVPVGLIQSAWGGTRAEAWTSGESLGAASEFKNEKPDPAKMNANSASGLYNAMIHPVLNYSIKGAIWYQGESNAFNPVHAEQYRRLFPLMIEDWRKNFKQGDFSFYFVQLAPFKTSLKQPLWAVLRESQVVTLKLKNTGHAVITDFGNDYDIHPTPKRPVGERLALVALARDYGQKIVFSGPMYSGLKIEGDKAVLSFDHTGGGLTSYEMVPTNIRKNKDGSQQAAWRVKAGTEGAKLVGFEIAGSDQKFVPAEATIKGNMVEVHSPMVAQPVAVRYGWANSPVCNLFNQEGLPASPFRSDSFALPK